MANIFAVPKYVKAASPEGLRRLMYSVQLKDSMQYNFTISFADGSWFAWYSYEPKTSNEQLDAANELVVKGS